MDEGYELSSDILQDFSSMVIGEEPVEKTDTIYGVIVEKDGQKYVRIDGSGLLAPVNPSVEIEDGDRVLVQLKNRELTAIGNVTAPASARTATNFMKLTTEGLMVGDLDKAGKPRGSYTLMKTDSYLIVDESGRVVGEFNKNGVYFGKKAQFTNEGVTLANDSGEKLATFDKNGIKLYDQYGVDIANYSSTGIFFKRDRNNYYVTFTPTGTDIYDEFGTKRVTISQTGLTVRDNIGNETVIGGNTSVYNVGNSIVTITGEKILIENTSTGQKLEYTSSGISKSVFANAVSFSLSVDNTISFELYDGYYRDTVSIKKDSFSVVLQENRFTTVCSLELSKNGVSFSASNSWTLRIDSSGFYAYNATNNTGIQVSSNQIKIYNTNANTLYYNNKKVLVEGDVEDTDLSNYFTKDQSDSRYYQKTEVYRKTETLSSSELSNHWMSIAEDMGRLGDRITVLENKLNSSSGGGSGNPNQPIG